MERLSSFLNLIGNRFDIVFSHIKSIDNYFVKTDEENIEKLLEDPIDRIKFEETVDELMKENKKSKEVKLKDKKVTISI